MNVRSRVQTRKKRVQPIQTLCYGKKCVFFFLFIYFLFGLLLFKDFFILHILTSSKECSKYITICTDYTILFVVSF